MKFWTVSIKDLDFLEGDIMTATFSTEPKTVAFKEKCVTTLEDKGNFQVCIDSGYLNDETYLEWFEDEF